MFGDALRKIQGGFFKVEKDNSRDECSALLRYQTGDQDEEYQQRHDEAEIIDQALADFESFAGIRFPAETASGLSM